MSVSKSDQMLRDVLFVAFAAGIGICTYSEHVANQVLDQTDCLTKERFDTYPDTSKKINAFIDFYLEQPEDSPLVALFEGNLNATHSRVKRMLKECLFSDARMPDGQARKHLLEAIQQREKEPQEAGAQARLKHMADYIENHFFKDRSLMRGRDYSR